MRYRRVFLGLGIGLFFVVLVQLFYPSDRALPWAQVDGTSIGGKTKSELASYLRAKYDSGNLEAQVRDKKLKKKLSETGIDIDYDRIFVAVADYPWWQRMLPFSAIIKGLNTDASAWVTIDKHKFASYSKELAALCHVEPENAAIIVKGDEVALKPAKNGTACSQKNLQKQVSNLSLAAHTTSFRVKTTTLSPVRVERDVKLLLQEAKKLVDRQITVSLVGKSYTVPRETLASWIVFHEDPKTKKLSITLSNEAIVEYLQAIQKDIYIAPGITTIQTVNGNEVSRSVGHNGRGIDTVKTVELLKRQALSESGKITAVLAVLPPIVKYNRSYTKSQEGLSALLVDIAKDKGDYGISVRQIGGNGWQAEANGGKQFETASTYKMFVAYAVLKRIEAKQMSWNDEVTGGRNTTQCFDDMIIQSDNPCAESFGQKIGWATIQNMMRAQGLNQTTLGSTFYSTANDETLFMEKLEKGELLQGASRDKLLDVMKRQVHRQGIPAGTGLVVADKVGFLNGLLHDSAIVYAPGGAYVMTIMTNGSSWGQIADAARQINDLLN